MKHTEAHARQLMDHAVSESKKVYADTPMEGKFLIFQDALSA